jgi:hypothetical protein
VQQAAITGRSGSSASRASQAIRWSVAILTVVAIAEGVIIAGRWLAAPVVVMGPPSPLADLASPPPALPPQAIADPVTAATSAGAPVASAAPAVAPPNPMEPAVRPASQPPADAETAAAPAPSTGRFGGVRLTSPIELQVFEAGTLVGSTAGPIAVSDGRHVFDLVNETLGFRSRTTVQVRAGQLVSVPVTLPNGRININAAPWAEVSINGTPAGQTPLANVAIPIGTHEIVFRHPQFGEQRHTVVVKAEDVTRVSASFQP